LHRGGDVDPRRGIARETVVDPIGWLRYAGLGGDDGCGFGTPDGPCPNPPVTSVAMAAAHPGDGRARWLLPAWTVVCAWHREAVDRCTTAEHPVPALWVARGGDPADHPPLVSPMRRGLARWLARTPDGLWSGELGL
jgi:hypothetical protein